MNLVVKGGDYNTLKNIIRKLSLAQYCIQINFVGALSVLPQIRLQ